MAINDAVNEFEQQEEPVVEKAVPVVPEVTKADLEAKQGEIDALKGEIGDLRSRTAIVDKLQEVFGGAGTKADPKDEFVRKEIERLVPELGDVAKIKQLLPEIILTLQASAEEAGTARAGEAQDVLKDLMGDVGLDSKDDEALGYLEEAVVKVIKQDKDLMAKWLKGNVKAAVKGGFDKVQNKLFGPVRAHTKRAAVRTITDTPKASPRGGAPSAGASAKPVVDLSDTSREGVRKAHDAAFERLQELMDR